VVSIFLDNFFLKDRFRFWSDLGRRRSSACVNTGAMQADRKMKVILTKKLSKKI